MTIIESTNRLLEFFAKNDFFELAKDFKKIILISDTDADKASILIALEELSKQNFVIKKNINGHEYWVLYKPLVFHTQEIQISLMTALAISESINKFITEDNDKINPMRISEQDLITLTMLIKKD